MPPREPKILAARRPIFDARRAIWGYELVFRACGEDSCTLVEQVDEEAVGSFLESFAQGAQNVPPDKTICLRVSLLDVLQGEDAAPPPGSLAVMVPPTRELDIGRHTWLGLQSDGYTLILDDYREQPEADAHLKMFDYVAVDFTDRSPQDILELRNAIKSSKRSLIAYNVPDWPAFEGAKALGFSLFHGPFFTEPEMSRGKTVPSELSTRLRLLRALSDENTPLEEIVSIIASDTPLSFRMLKYINSPAFGLSSDVSTIARAASMLGMRPLRSWAMAAIVTDMDTSEKGAEVSWLSLHRAFFLKLTCKAGHAGTWDPEALFLVGLLSTLDAVLGVPMQQVLEDLPLADELKEALMGNDPVYANWDQIMNDLEHSRLEAVQARIKQLGVPAHKAAMLYMKATDLASEALGVRGFQ